MEMNTTVVDRAAAPVGWNWPGGADRSADRGSVRVGMPLSSLALTEDEYIDELRQLYLFTDDREVSTFLKRRPHLMDLLFEALVPIRRSFPAYEQRHLKIHVDPESGQRSLFVLIVTSEQTAAALARLENLDQDWWLEALPRAKGEMVISLRLV